MSLEASFLGSCRTALVRHGCALNENDGRPRAAFIADLFPAASAVSTWIFALKDAQFRPVAWTQLHQIGLQNREPRPHPTCPARISVRTDVQTVCPMLSHERFRVRRLHRDGLQSIS